MMLITDKVYFDITAWEWCQENHKPTPAKPCRDCVPGHAKGMNVARLSPEAFRAWFLGAPPKQTQVQRANFVKAMLGEPMFFDRTKVGEILASPEI
jgi:hypothetical protein